MGGSSLAPEVFRRVVRRRTRAACACTCSTPPTPTRCATSRRASTRHARSSSSRRSPAGRSRRCRSSEHFWAQAARRRALRRDHRPGLARSRRSPSERGFRRTFLNDPDIGGRYSALSYFGLVPAALMGADVARRCSTARAGRRAGVQRLRPSQGNCGLWLGVHARRARAAGPRQADVRRRTSRCASFGLWVEQLVAESTGQAGQGHPARRRRAARRAGASTATTASSCTCATPDAADEASTPDGRARRRRPPGPHAAARGPGGPRADLLLRRVRHRGRRLGARRQPVRPAQRAGGQGQTTSRVARGGRCRRSPRRRRRAARCSTAPAPPDYVAIMGYAAPSDAVDAAIAELRAAIRDATAGHDDVRLRPALPALDRPVPQGRRRERALPRSSCTTAEPDAEIPGEPFTFEQLKRAQAAGDLRDAARARPAGRARRAARATPPRRCAS